MTVFHPFLFEKNCSVLNKPTSLLDVAVHSAGMDAGPMNSLSADGLVETLKHLDTRQGAQWLASAQAFASKIQDRCWGKLPWLSNFLS